MASPFSKPYLYISPQSKSSPVDFFNIDKKNFPKLKKANLLFAKIDKGDCIYVPENYYIQLMVDENE